ncbi:hypothetical protein [Clostridium aciditolerans]|nr:hypothetical protein [Clostridium aciditolerans]
MKEMPKDVNFVGDKKSDDSKKVKTKKKESCRFLFDMIGRILPRG